MRSWYHHHDLLDSPEETIINDACTLAETVHQILMTSGLQRIS